MGQQDDVSGRVARLSPRQRELLARLTSAKRPAAGGITRRPPGLASIPASFEQERLWFMDRLVPYRAAYYIPIALRLRGPVDADALRQAFDGVVRRHEVLRTVFAEENGVPVQRVLPELELALPVVDLSAQADPEAAARSRAVTDGTAPFDLTAGPMMRTRLYRLGAEDHVLLIAVHHIVSDFWSLAQLFAELEVLYALARGLPAGDLPDLPVQYADFALWQREWLRDETRTRLLDYWTEHLRDAPDLIDLPLDRPRPAQRSAQGRFFPIRFDAGAIAELRQLARAEGATLHVAMLTAFKALLARYCGQPDVVVGTPIAGRGRSEIQPLIGYFLNWLVLRTRVGDDPTFRDLLRRVRDAAMGAYAHQDLPFEELVQALKPRRDLSSTPIFQVSFSLRDGNLEPPRLSGCAVELFGLPGGATHYDLMADLYVDGDTIAGNLPYNEDLFDESTVARMADQLHHLLAAAVAAPDTPLSQLPLLDRRERARLVRMWPGAHRPSPHCLHQIFQQRARENPDAVAVAFEDERISYAELDQRANRLAHLLRDLGAGPDRIVAICTERSADLVVAVLAVLKAGAAYLPLDPDHPRDRIAYMLADAGAVALVSQQSLQSRLPADLPPTLWLDADAPRVAAAPGHDPAVVVAPANLAYVIYTSGSTGAPKGTLITHANVTRLFTAAEGWLDLGPADVWTLFHSYAFDFSVWEIWGPLLYGGRLVVVPLWVTRAPDAMLKLLADEGVTVLNQTPSAFAQLQRLALDEAAPRTDLRLVIFGGEALETEMLRPWFERFGERRPQLVNMYGITETTVHVTYRPMGTRDLDGAARSVVGRPLLDLAAYVLDHHLEPVPCGVAGELYVGGPGLARGYLGRPGLTAQRFLPDPFAADEGSRMYRTGDRVRLLANGDLAYLGRVDDQVKIRGHRIELGEINNALGQHPAVREALVLMRADGSHDRRLVGYVVPAGTPPTVSTLRRFLVTRLPDYMIPAAFVVLDRFPLTSNGKVDRRALPPPTDARPEVGNSYLAPRDAQEAALAAIWADVLKLDRVGVQDNFFDLGGHSLVAVQVLSRIRESTGVELALATVFQHPTVEGLATALGEAARDQTGDGLAAAGVADTVSSLSDEEVEAMLASAARGGELAPGG